MLAVDKHALQGTFHSIACPHQKHDGKSTWERSTHTQTLVSHVVEVSRMAMWLQAADVTANGSDAMVS